MFIVDNPPSAGLGHVMRCSQLLEQVVTFECKVVWLTDGNDYHELSVFESPQVKAVVMQKPLGKISDEEWITVIAHHQPSHVVIDSYQLQATVLNTIAQFARQQNIKLLGMDDGHFFAHDGFDYLVNAARKLPECVGSEVNNLQNTTYLMGLPYTIVRTDIQKAKNNSSMNKSCLGLVERPNLLITFGASDVLQLTLPILECLISDLTFEKTRFNIQVVIGPQVESEQPYYSSCIQKFCRAHELDCWVSPTFYPRLVAEADVAITAAGSSIFEFAFCGVPSVVVTVAENQRGAAMLHSESGWCSWVDATMIAIDKTQIATQVVAALNDLTELESRYSQKSALAESLIDGKGAQRIIKEFLSSVQ